MKEFLKKVKDKVISLFRKLTGTVKIIIPTGIKVVNAIKTFTDSNIADVIVELTVNTDLDNKILKQVRNLLPKILKQLDEWNERVNGTEEEILKESLAKINGYPEIKRNLLYLGIATELNRELSNGELSYRESLTATHEAYNDPELLNV